MNARSEIALSTDWSAKAPPLDGCTAFAWKQDGRQWSGQNWDWKEIATDFLIVIEIDAHEETGRPAIKMMTEAGVVSCALSDTLRGYETDFVLSSFRRAADRQDWAERAWSVYDAQRIEGQSEPTSPVDLPSLTPSSEDVCLQIPSNRFDSLPVHLFLRRMLERPSLPSALTYLHEQCHNASASTANVVLADPDSAVSIELHPDQSEVIEPDEEGFVRHTNHLVQLNDEREMFLWPDSMRRLPRLETLTRQALEQGEKVRYETYRRILSDRSDGERSICRFEAKGIVTVFSIAVDCAGRRAEVKLGRPDEEGEVLVLEFAYRGD